MQSPHYQILTVTSGRQKASRRYLSGLSLTELLIVVGVIGLVAAIGLPAIGNVRESARRASAKQNAKNVNQMSEALNALGVAHIIPDSMGGVEATVRLFREGVVVAEGPMAGQRFALSGLRDEEIEWTAQYLRIEYREFDLQLVYVEPGASTFLHRFGNETLLCLREGRVVPMAVRIGSGLFGITR